MHTHTESPLLGGGDDGGKVVSCATAATCEQEETERLSVSAA